MGCVPPPLRAPPLAIALAVAALLVSVIALPQVNDVGASPGPPYTYNVDPFFLRSNNDQVWDPNFLPGFPSEPEARILWQDPTGGPAQLSYLVGPLATAPNASEVPHFAVGPQTFNFVEVPRTQVFRSPSWGDYHYVQEGFLPCAVNAGNVTPNATQALHPLYLGMPETGVDWQLQVGLRWVGAEPLLGLPYEGSLAIDLTTTLPATSSDAYPSLVYTDLILWQGASSGSSSLVRAGAVSTNSTRGGTVSFVVDDLSASVPEARSYVLDLTNYLGWTLGRLGLDPSGALLSYTYLSATGYNVQVQASLSSWSLQSSRALCPLPSSSGGWLPAWGALVGGLLVVAAVTVLASGRSGTGARRGAPLSAPRQASGAPALPRSEPEEDEGQERPQEDPPEGGKPQGQPGAPPVR